MRRLSRIKTWGCLLGAVVYAGAAAQEPSRWVGFNGGLTQLRTKDLFHSPYTYKGSGPGFGLTYAREQVRTQWRLEVDYARIHSRSAVSRKASTRLLDLALRYGWRFSPTDRAGKRLQYDGGVGLRFFGNSTNYSPDIDVATVQATAVLSLGAFGKATYRLNPLQSVQLQTFVSGVSAVYRPNYAYYGRDQAKASWTGQSPMLDAQLSFHHRFGKAWKATGRYQVSYFKYDRPRPVHLLRQGIALGVERLF